MYQSYYKLAKAPFLLTPDPHFLCLADSHRAALLELILSVATGKPFTVMLGPVGTGKTTLLNAALQLLAKRPQIVSGLIVNPVLTRDELLETIIDEFNVECNGATKPQRLTSLHTRLLEIEEKGGKAVLVIDEAHLLTFELLEEIRLLSNMDLYRGKLLQVVLCGQPELASVLLDPRLRALRQRISGLVQLRPLTLQETNSYIVRRLSVGGLTNPTLFTSAAVQQIYDSTKGVPRLINLLCDTALTIGCETARPQIEPDIVRAAVGRLSSLELLNTAAPSIDAALSKIIGSANPSAMPMHAAAEGTKN